jgi:hypothetical protein
MGSMQRSRCLSRFCTMKQVPRVLRYRPNQILSASDSAEITGRTSHVPIGTYFTKSERRVWIMPALQGGRGGVEGVVDVGVGGVGTVRIVHRCREGVTWLP